MSPVALLVAALTAAAPAVAPKTFAIVVGTNAAPDDTRRNLRFADDDAARYYQLFRTAGADVRLLTSFDGESQAVFADLVDRAIRPNRANFVRVVDEVLAKVERAWSEGQQTVLYFYYAGHGQLIDDEGSITLIDGPLNRRDFRSLFLARSRATLTHVIVDACKSYFFVAGRGGLRREAYGRGFAGPEIRDNVGYVLSTSNDADSHEWAAFGGGIVSHEVRSALVGGADANGDGAVDYRELAAFVRVANEAVPVARYRPNIYIQPPDSRRAAPVFSPRPSADTARVSVDLPGAGRLIVHDGRGVRYADVHKAAGEAISLTLGAPFPHRLQWGARTYLVPRPARRGAALKLTDLPFTETSTLVSARGDIHEAFTHLFTTPFDRDVVRGFRLAEDRVDTILRSAPVPEKSVWVPALVGSSAVILGTGIALTVLAADARVDSRAGPQADRPAAADRANAFQYSAGAAYAVGATALVAGLVLYFLEE